MRVRVQGTLFDVNPLDHIGRIMSRGTWYERDLLSDLHARVTSGTAIDVGAHIGNHTVFMATKCGLDVVALEPNPVARKMLHHHVAINDLESRVTVLPMAAGASHGYATLVPGPPKNSGMARTSLANDGDIEVIPIDELDLHDVSVIKIDVEGAHMQVLEGARNTITRERPVLYVETDDPAEVEVWLGQGWTRGGKFGRTATWCFLPHTAQVSVAIMAHPSRKPQVHDLIEQLDVEPTVIWDRHNDRWDTGRRAWLEGIDSAASHGLVLQDDVTTCPDLIAGLQRMLVMQPVTQSRPVSLYIGRSRARPRRWSSTPWVRRAQRFHHSFLELEGPWWGQGVLMPAEAIESCISYGDLLTNIAHYDHRLALYWRDVIDRHCLYTVPCLVNHRIGPSLLEHGMGPGRTAVATHPRSAIDINWGSAITVTNAPPLQYTEQETRPHAPRRDDHRAPTPPALGPGTARPAASAHS
jgi:FkbM family methyltransferase